VTVSQGFAENIDIKDTAGYFTSTEVESALAELYDLYPVSALETANGITPTDLRRRWGDVFRYGAVADSGPSSQGTDNAAAFQRAVDSGHHVYIPEGYYACESTVTIFSANNYSGKRVTCGAGVRIERFANVATPIFHVSGQSNRFEGNGVTLAARSYGAFTKGLFLLGPDPAATSTADASVLTQTSWNIIDDVYIIGKESITIDDGSVGFYTESSARKRGSFLTPTNYTTYYNTVRSVQVTQMDYGFFFSTDANANSYNDCACTSFGTSSYKCKS
jgi:hypothetical protein